jgi:hypothetical protein
MKSVFLLLFLEKFKRKINTKRNKTTNQRLAFKNLHEIDKPVKFTTTKQFNLINIYSKYLNLTRILSQQKI